MKKKRGRPRKKDFQKQLQEKLTEALSPIEGIQISVTPFSCGIKE